MKTCATHHPPITTSVTGKNRPSRIPSAFHSTNAIPRSNSTAHTTATHATPASNGSAIAFQYSARSQSPPSSADAARVPPHIAHGNPLKFRNPQGTPGNGPTKAFTTKIPKPIPIANTTTPRIARS